MSLKPVAVILAALFLLGAASPHSSLLSAAAEKVNAEDWPRAIRTLKRFAAKTAKAKPTESEAEEVGKLALLRALTAAGESDARRADWYWWVARMFLPHLSAEDDLGAHGKAGRALAEMIRPVPAPRPLSASSIDKTALTRTVRERHGRTTLQSRACERQDVKVRFVASTGEDGYFQAPRRAPEYPFAVRPLCVYAIVDSYRDKRYGLSPGFISHLVEDLSIKVDRRP